MNCRISEGRRHITKKINKIEFRGDFYAWKGYNFNILNELDDEDYIRQGNHLFRSKSVYITETGI